MLDTCRIKDIIGQIKGKRIIVIGDVMLDHYIMGSATRLSPEAPVPVLIAAHDSFIAGGAANVAANLSSLGVDTEICGICGNDFAGQQLRSIMGGLSVNYEPAFMKEGLATIIKTRVVAGNHQICRIDREANFESYDLSIGDISRAIINKIKHANAVIISDYAKGAISNTFLKILAQTAREYGVLLLVDMKPKNRFNIEGIDLLKPNKSEALELAGISLNHQEKFPAEEVCQKIWKLLKPKYLVITLGADGILLSKEGRVMKIIPTVAKEVFDVSGAGDTTMAALGAAIGAGIDIEEAIAFANLCAGIVVGKYGTATASIEDIVNYSHLNKKHEEVSVYSY